MDNNEQTSTDHASIGDWVLYKNNQLIALAKPPGIPVQSDLTGDKSLLQLAEIYTKSKLYLIHRLDRPASGVVLFAKVKKAVGTLSDQFQARTVRKVYLAVVHDRPEKDAGTVQHFLQKNGKTKRAEVHAEEVPGSQRAELSYRLLGSSDNYHLLQVELATGRFHQIRAQLAALGCPIKGDVKYGARRSNSDRSIHLHAWKLGFQHPISGEEELLTAPLPAGPVWDFFRENILETKTDEA